LHQLLPGAQQSAIIIGASFACWCTTGTTDGSYQRAQWHGWGDVSLLKEEGYQGEQQQQHTLAYTLLSYFSSQEHSSL
jgi:hypothetical protein